MKKFAKDTIILQVLTTSLSGLSIVVSEREGETDEEMSFSYNPNQRIKNYYLDHYRYVQYVRIKTSHQSTGMVLGEVEVYAFSEYILSKRNGMLIMFQSIGYLQWQ